MVKVAQAYEVVRINKRAKGVKPDGHGEATHGHELHLHELTSIVPRWSLPNSPPTRLGHGGLIGCG
jgi:hypothetical protein